MLKLAYFTGHENEAFILGRVAKRLKDIAHVRCITQSDLSLKRKREEFEGFAERAHITIFRLMGGKDTYPGIEKLAEKIKGKIHIAIGSEEVHHLKNTGDIGDRIDEYISFGGEKNFENLILFLAKKLAGINTSFQEPEPLPWEGIYHPDIKEPENEYLKKLDGWDGPVIGLWFHRSTWINMNTRHIDALIREIEKLGAKTIPVFLQGWKDEKLGNLDYRQVIEKFFIKNRKPRIHVLINLLMFSSLGFWRGTGGEGNFFEKLNVPVIHAISMLVERKAWKASPQGLSPMDVAISVAMPEFDGVVVTVPISGREIFFEDEETGATVVRNEPINERIRKVARLALKWAEMARKDRSSRKLAIILHNYPPRDDTVGCAFCLDAPESVARLLKRLKGLGYTVEETPESGNELIKKLLSKATNDTRWRSRKEIIKRAVDVVDGRLYKKWFDELPEKLRKEMLEEWGEPDEEIAIPGFINGNVFIGIQPPRGVLESEKAIYHDPNIPIPHRYYAFYRWIRDVFRADALIHVGKHGNLEWLPGKSVGLSEECFPDAVIKDMPNIYPYIVNDPGEGTQAKRRSYCVIIDHLIPTMHRAELYDNMAELERLVNEYREADSAKKEGLKKVIWEKVEKNSLNLDLKLTKEKAFSNFDGFILKLHSYLQEVADTKIRDGLHILGEAPEGEKMDKFLAAMTRLPVGNAPSLREALKKELGTDLGKLDDASIKLFKALRETGSPSKAQMKVLGKTSEEITEVLELADKALIPNLRKTELEIDNLISSIEGGYVPPGPSGCPTQGDIDVLPTGRNFFSVDPRTIPSRGAWIKGVELGKKLLERYLKEEGRYPETVGIVVWGSPTMRTKGDDIAEILFLLGLEPIWGPGGRINGTKVIPLNELGRPRIDVVLRISGLFRDTFPSVVELLDEAFEKVARLEEPPDRNFVRKHFINELEERIKSGMDKEEAEELSLYRIFGCPPGTYGSGVSEAIDSKKWKDRSDLGMAYLAWSGFAYGRKVHGKVAKDLFKKRLSTVEVAVKNLDNREFDILDCDDFYAYHGGFIAAVETFKGEKPKSYIGDSSNPSSIKTKDLKEEIRLVFRSRVLNPKWIESMKKHGYAGAMDLSRVVDFTLGWDATSDVVEKWMYDGLAEKYALDENVKKWLKEVNPHALQNITERLIEAARRGLWEADDETLEKLERELLEAEGILEEE